MPDLPSVLYVPIAVFLTTLISALISGNAIQYKWNRELNSRLRDNYEKLAVTNATTLERNSEALNNTTRALERVADNEERTAKQVERLENVVWNINRSQHRR